MNKTVGFIGFGNMAKAMAGGMIEGGVTDKKNIIVSASTDKTLKNAQDTYGINVTMDNKEVAKKSGVPAGTYKAHTRHYHCGSVGHRPNEPYMSQREHHF